jgi:hypothetical protein
MFVQRMIRHLSIFGVLISVPVVSLGSHTEVFIDEMPTDFSNGDLTTSTLTWDGKIVPPFRREKLATLDQVDVVWDMVQIGKNRFLGTGHEGQLFEQSGTDDAVLRHDFEETALFALSEGPNGSLLVGASPGGIVYQLKDDKEAEVFAETGTEMIWDLMAEKNSWLVATGTPASVLRVDDEGTTSTLAALDFVENVLDLEYDAKREAVIAATQGPGLVASIDADGKVTVLMDPQQEEVRRVAILPDGSVLGAVNGKRSKGNDALQRANGSGGSMPGMDMAMAMGMAGGGGDNAKPASFVVRIYPDGHVEEWWVSPETPIHDLYAHENGSVFVSAGEQGKLFEVTARGKTNQLGLADEQFLTRLAPIGAGAVLAGTGMKAALFELNFSYFGKGIYESRVFDGKGTVDWKRVWAMATPGEGTLRLSTRSGNVLKPDETWYPWTEPVDFAEAVIECKSPVARYFQYRVEMETPYGVVKTPPTVEQVKVFYTRPNTAPSLTDVKIGNGKKSGNSAPPMMMMPGMPSPSAMSNGSKKNGSSSHGEAISWKATDPDGDDLLYTLSLQSSGEDSWVLVEEEIKTPSFKLDANQIPDGEYRVKVEVTDAPSNQKGDERQDEDVSPLFLVDHTPPMIEVISEERVSATKVNLRIKVQDAASLVSKMTWRYAFEDEQVLLPFDKAFDQKEEDFVFTLEGDAAKKGAFVVLLATDEKENTRIYRLELP